MRDKQTRRPNGNKRTKHALNLLDFFEIVSENTTWLEGQREEILDSGKYKTKTKNQMPQETIRDIR
jgi:hypothetical protein